MALIRAMFDLLLFGRCYTYTTVTGGMLRGPRVLVMLAMSGYHWCQLMAARVIYSCSW